jgi:hypothetical protein
MRSNMNLLSQQVEGISVTAAVARIQCTWRCFSAKMYVAEKDILARRYAATIFQRAYRAYSTRSSQLSEDQFIRAVVAVQAMQRGDKARAALIESVPSPSPPPPSPYESPMRVASSRSPEVDEGKLTPVRTAEVAPHVNNFMIGELFREIHAENWAMVENILEKYPELAESPDLKTGELALHKMARHNGAWKPLMETVLVLYPKALMHRDNMGAMPIHHASAHDNLTALEIIYSAYEKGINDTDKMGRLPIHVAANYDAVDSIKFLLSNSPKGASTMVNRPPADAGGGLPLHIACSNHASIDVMTALLADNFASAKRTDENGDLPLHLLLRCGEEVDPVVVTTLLTCFSGALSRTDMNGDLPLSISIKYQCRPAVINAVLMQYPEAAGALNGYSHSPLFLAFKHNADDRTIMSLLNHAPELAIQADKKTGLLPIQVATENEHSRFIVDNLLKRDLPIDLKEKVRARLVPHHYSWNHVVSNTDDLYHQVITKVLQSCTQPQVRFESASSFRSCCSISLTFFFFNVL